MNHRIQLLPQDVIRQLKAGEVVERPFNILKELLENSLDAQSQSIRCDLWNGGKDLIRITDDGQGIPAEDLSQALEAHTTSKITHIEDIGQSGTLGFRGEALHAISTFAQLDLSSRHENNSQAFQISSKDLTIQPSALSQGTQITVHNLFQHHPVRAKFLRSTSQEWFRLSEMLQAYAFKYHKVAFEVWHNGKKSLSLRSQESPMDRFESLLPGSKDFYYFADIAYQGLKIQGFFKKPQHCSQKNKKKILFLNDRFIQNHFIHNLVKEAYQGFLPHQSQADYILFLKTPHQWIDVNAHPMKLNVRLRDPDLLSEYLSRSLQKWLTEKIKEEQAHQYVPIPQKSTLNFFPQRSSQPSPPLRSSHPQTSTLSIPHSQPNQAPSQIIPLTYSPFISNSNQTPVLPRQKPYRFLGQFANCFLIFQQEEELIIFDQHALHERIQFESFLKEKEEVPGIKQNLLTPLQVPHHPLLKEFLEQQEENLSFLGFTIEINTEFFLKAYPSFLTPSEIPLILDLIVDLSQKPLHFSKSDLIRYLFYDIIAGKACRKSIKAGDEMSDLEAYALLEQAEKSHFWTSCPHGRPVIKKFHAQEVGRWFQRL